jgi:Protein of unknown function (DUF3180)
MTATGAGRLAALGVACALVVWLLLRHFYTSLPPLPWTAVPTLLLLAIVEAWSGRLLRARLSSRAGTSRNDDPTAPVTLRPLPPIAMARAAALAKASAYAGAVVAGIAGGFVLYLPGSLDKAIPRGDVFSALGTFLGAVALAAGALYLERSCRVPREPGGPDREGAGR